ncbi:hypothetical protein DAPPUDRAFT_305005 [Daphnia pulex]|uniref:Secreted protein n=1 Tax=Daphnia pulex TaxID=6669 RepID=E9GND3_DAPPU|nr:hypothetical protein DAPPUDRAFT_305005 [Daphnia pulex]|eukprot:EFX79046.1 hypothetical protein DAPPUDRAFT_305005 [Daphnia pulex]
MGSGVLFSFFFLVFFSLMIGPNNAKSAFCRSICCCLLLVFSSTSVGSFHDAVEVKIDFFPSRIFNQTLSDRKIMLVIFTPCIFK